MAEYTPNRLKSGVVKADQLKETGAAYVVTSCHNCVDGLGDVIKHYEIDMKVTQLVNLVANALVIDEKVAVPVEAPPEPEVVEEIPVPMAVPVGVGAAGEELPLAGRRILVADDEPDQLDYLSAVLEDAGAEVLTATNGDEVLEVAKREKPDILTLDLHMPGRDVGEVFELIREDPELEDLKICIITGKPELRKLIYDRTVRPPEGYVDKPVDEKRLLLNIRKVLEVVRQDA
jgi:CheY-like chemotaxis protein